MSHALAIAAVTAVLKDLLEKGLVSEAIVSSVGDVIVTALPPDRISVGADERAQLNLFLYQVSQNRNADWMMRDRPLRSPDVRPPNPPLAIDLHYLLTTYGAKDFHSELLLGYAMQVLHDMPVLTQQEIYTALKHISQVNTSSVFAQALTSVSISDLAAKLGQIKISPEFFNMEETSKLWSSLQTHYRPSAGYQVSMVWIASRHNQQQLGGIPGLQPVIQQVSGTGFSQAIVTGGNLLLQGQQLRGEVNRIRIDGNELLLVPQEVQDTQIVLPVPADLKVGIHGVQVVHLNAKTANSISGTGVESNVAAFVLHPAIAAVVNCQQGNGGEVTVKFKPKVSHEQRVILLLHALSPQATETRSTTYTFIAPSRTSDTDAIAFTFTGIPLGKYLVQVQVDGAESLLQCDRTGVCNSPQIEIV